MPPLANRCKGESRVRPLTAVHTNAISRVLRGTPPGQGHTQTVVTQRARRRVRSRWRR